MREWPYGPCVTLPDYSEIYRRVIYERPIPIDANFPVKLQDPNLARGCLVCPYAALLEAFASLGAPLGISRQF